MTEYKLITDSKQTDFVIKVNEALKEGWKLQGGVATHDFFYTQAMIKEDKSVKQKA